MTIEEAREHVGHGVVYRPAHGGDRPEQGIITSVGLQCVFVRYGVDDHSKATRPGDLILLAPKGAE